MTLLTCPRVDVTLIAHYDAPVLVYSPRYDFSLFGLERLHPFDARKFSRAWARLEQRLGGELERYWEAPPAPIAEADLSLVHEAVRWPSAASPPSS
ncbi:MAG TPA: hypothetical protein VNN80_29145 [Polyangiaceae bacterium]|nr:hypothetical protein [Polyangiaceae bacterium]